MIFQTSHSKPTEGSLVFGITSLFTSEGISVPTTPVSSNAPTISTGLTPPLESTSGPTVLTGAPSSGPSLPVNPSLPGGPSAPPPQNGGGLIASPSVPSAPSVPSESSVPPVPPVPSAPPVPPVPSAPPVPSEPSVESRID